MNSIDILAGGFVGVLATGLLDLWALMLRAVAGIATPNWAMVGRWVAHLPRGMVFHDDIGQATPVSSELAVGWGFHYAVGAVYGIGLIAFMGADWRMAPTFWPAWAFSIAMLGFGWFLLLPGLGLGWAASRTPNPTMVRALGLVAHTVFGFGLWLGAMIVF